jgi:hypothetical protein
MPLDPRDPLPQLGQVPDPYFTGGSRITSGELPALLNQLAQAIGYTNGQTGGGFARSWTFQTNTAVGYAGGFYDHAAGDDDFSPSITFGTPNTSVAAHFYIVTGAPAVDDVRIQVLGSGINDDGVRTPLLATTITIPAGTPANSYFETPEKWNGQVSVGVTSGTPITCNYGYAKYHDAGNRNFTIAGLETLWESDSTDATSDIELIHHKATGWTFNAGAVATPPTPLAARSVDHGPDNEQYVGQGAWKRSNLDTTIAGSASEGILFRVTSGSTGLGSLSFRLLTLEVSLGFTA